MAPKEPSRKRKSVDSVPKDAVALKKTKTARANTNEVKKKAAQPTATTKAKPKTTNGKQSKPEKPSKAVVPTGDLAQDDFTGFGSDADSDGDQTAALLAGFASSDDEDDGPTANASEQETSKPIPALPDSAELQTKLDKASSSTQPGTVYIGRLPHGFYEHQMSGYFSQFGAITRLRMAHNRRTGASKHYAFVEFESDEVAKIVADTMDGYLMYGHILRVKYVPAEKVHAKLWEGAGRRFRKIPWNRIEKNKLEMADWKTWEKRAEREKLRREKRAKALKEMGYIFNIPALKSVARMSAAAGVGAAQVDDDGEADVPKQIEAAPELDGTVEELIQGKTRAVRDVVTSKTKAAASVAPVEELVTVKTSKSHGRKKAVKA